MDEAIVIGVSAGGLHALGVMLPALPGSLRAPVAVVQHIERRSDAFLAEYLNSRSVLNVKEAEDKEPLCAGYVYVAPAGYHLLIESDRSFSLSLDEKVNYCRPSIDVLFESAADAYGAHVIGVVLTGANTDGAKGLKAIKGRGGIAIVQNPLTAHAAFMPQAALDAVSVDHVTDIENIAPLLVELTERSGHDTGA